MVNSVLKSRSNGIKQQPIFSLFVGFVFFVVTSSVATANSPPLVSNITVSQQTDGSKVVDIYYDLADADGDPCLVEVQGSNDGGSTWTVPITALGGDVGPGVIPGTGKHIVWNSWTDLPGVVGNQFRVHICAEDGPSGGMTLIPAGEYLMGDHHDGMSDALPLHSVTLDAFYMDRYEVTNAQYAEALNWAYAQGGLITVTSGVVYKYNSGTSYPYCSTSSEPGYELYSRITWDGSTFGAVAGKENHPMVMVNWYGAAAYANWRSAIDGRTPSYDTSTWECNFAANGYRLPTEAEWEKASRGGLYDPYRRYPWGDTLDGSNANYWASGDPYEMGTSAHTTPVGYYNGGQTPPGVDMGNGYGLYDMAGNVWELCNDWWASDYYASSPSSNPRGPASGGCRVRRGGSWDNNDIGLRCAIHTHCLAPDIRDRTDGFRLALDAN